ncbi:MAG: hypothetical protein ABH803_03940 [Candidatus Micrarchaeota archaeon]
MIFDKVTRITVMVATFLFGAFALYSLWPFYLGIQNALFPALVEGWVLMITTTLIGIACIWSSWGMYKSLRSPLYPHLSENNLIVAGMAAYGIGFTALLYLIDFVYLSQEAFVFDLTFGIIVLMGTAGLLGGRLLTNAGLNLKPHESATRHLLKKFGLIKVRTAPKAGKNKRRKK